MKTALQIEDRIKEIGKLLKKMYKDKGSGKSLADVFAFDSDGYIELFGEGKALKWVLNDSIEKNKKDENIS